MQYFKNKRWKYYRNRTFILEYCKKYRGDEGGALSILISASSPLSKNLVYLNQKALKFFYRIGLSPNAFWFIDFLFAKNH